MTTTVALYRLVAIRLTRLIRRGMSARDAAAELDGVLRDLELGREAARSIAYHAWHHLGGIEDELRGFCDLRESIGVDVLVCAVAEFDLCGTAPYALVSQYVGAVKVLGAAGLSGFVNAVLRALLMAREGRRRAVG